MVKFSPGYKKKEILQPAVGLSWLCLEHPARRFFTRAAPLGWLRRLGA
jgi:hypothetical protein